MSKLELKIPPLAVFLLFGAAMWVSDLLTPGYEFNALFRGVCIALLLFASAVFGIGGLYGFRQAETTVNPLDPERSTSLVTGGVYRLSRNPMYLALLLALAAWGLLLSNFYALAISGLFVPYMNRFQVLAEERAMEQLYGETFAAYREKVRRWI